MLQATRRLIGSAPTHTARGFAVATAHKVSAKTYWSLDEVEPLWQRMDGDCDCTVFQTWPVFKAWTEHIARSHPVRWFVVALHDDATGQPLLALPLILHRDGDLETIEGADLGIADFYAPVIARGFVPTAAEMLAYWEQIRTALPAADVLRLSKMPTRIGRARNPLLLLDNVNPIKLSNLKTELDGDWPQWFTANVPEKVRRDLAARRRKLAKRGDVRLVVADTDAEASRFFDALITQRRERFAALGRSDILDDPACRDFYRSLLRPEAPTSLAEIQALMVGDDIVAVGYGLVHNAAFHMIFPGFQGNGWRNYSPGLQLFVGSMEACARRGFRHYDFTIGGEAFKRDLGAESYPLYEKLIALSLRGKHAVYIDRLRRFVRRNPQLARLSARLRGVSEMEHAA